MTTDNSFGALKDVQVGAQMDPEQEKKELAKLNLQYEIYKEQFEDILSVFVDVRDAGDEIADKDVKKAFDKSVDAARAAMDRFMNLEFVDEITTSMKVVTIQNDLIWKIKELVKEMAELADVDIVQEKISNREGDKKSQVEQDSELFAFFEDPKTVVDENESVSVDVNGKSATGKAQEIDNVAEKISWHEAKEEAQGHGKDNLMIREELGIIQKEVSKMDKAIDKLQKGTEKNNAVKELKEFKAQAAQRLHDIVQEKIAIEEQRKKNAVESNKQTDDAEYNQLIKDAKKNYKKNKKLQEFVTAVDDSVKKKKEKLEKEKNPKRRKQRAQALQKYLTDVTTQIQGRISNAEQKSIAKNTQKKEPIATQDDNADVLSLDDEDVPDTLQLDNDELGGVDENLFSDEQKEVDDELSLDGDNSDLKGVDEGLFSIDENDYEDIAGELVTKNVQIEGIDGFEENEREIVTSVFIFAQKTFENVDAADEEKMLEFVDDIKRELIEEYSVMEQQRLEKMTQIVLDNLNIDSSALLQQSQESNATKQNDGEKEQVVDRIAEIERDFGKENMQILLDRTSSFYQRMKKDANWDNFDDMEREDALAELTEKFIIDVVSMINDEYAQQFTPKDAREVFGKLLALE